MSLSCSCGDWEPEPGDVAWFPPSDYTTLTLKVSRECNSCGIRFKPADVCTEILRAKVPDSDIEISIYGDEFIDPCDGPRRRSHWMCESCSDIYFSLEELGYCVEIGDMRELLADYQEQKKWEREHKEEVQA